jgi:hypothetical protein
MSKRFRTHDGVRVRLLAGALFRTHGDLGVRMAAFKNGYEKSTGIERYVHLNCALLLCRTMYPLPVWVLEGLIEVLLGRLPDQSVMWGRWMAVGIAKATVREVGGKKRKTSWPEAYLAASQLLKDTPCAGNPRAMREAYRIGEGINKGLTYLGQKKPS